MKLDAAQTLATKLIFDNLGSTWSFSWNNRAKSFGMCDYRTNTIQLSKRLTPGETDEAIELTIRHEIAHAIVGQGHGHDDVWEAAAKRMGIENPTRTRASTASPEDTIKPTWVMVFENEIITEYYRKPTKKAFEAQDTGWVANRKEETQGRLKLMSYSDYCEMIAAQTAAPVSLKKAPKPVSLKKAPKPVSLKKAPKPVSLKKAPKPVESKPTKPTGSRSKPRTVTVYKNINGSWVAVESQYCKTRVQARDLVERITNATCSYTKDAKNLIEKGELMVEVLVGLEGLKHYRFTAE